MPISISPVDWQPRALSLQLCLQRGNKFTDLLVEGAFAVKVVVVFGHSEQAFPRNVPSAQHSLQEGNHIFLRFRTTKRNHQNSVVIHAEIILRLDRGEVIVEFTAAAGSGT